MPSTNAGHYDQTLLAEAPAATRAQLQEGYNADILQPARRPDAHFLNGSPENGFVSKETIGHGSSHPAPFWRTKKGIIIIIIVAIVIIGAVVGGAVGGTVGKKNNNSSDDSGQGSSSGQGSGSGPGEQGAGASSAVSISTTAGGQSAETTSSSTLSSSLAPSSSAAVQAGANIPVSLKAFVPNLNPTPVPRKRRHLR